MKKVVLVALIATVAFTAKAQDSLWGATAADSVKCWENYNIAGSYYQNKNYAEAYDAWYQLFITCPGAKKNTFKIAPKIIEAKIEKTTNPAAKQELVKVLIEQYDVRMQLYPKEEGYVKSEKATKYLKYNEDSIKTAYSLFREAFEAAGNDMYPSQLNYYFISAVRMKNTDDIDMDELLNVYNFITDALDYNIIKYSKEVNSLQAMKDSNLCDAKCEKNLGRNERILDGYDKVQSNIEKMLAPTLTCDKLSLIYNKETYDEHAEDMRWLKTAAKMLEKEKVDEEGNVEDCTDNPIYFVIAEALYKKEPSAQAARSMAILAYKKGSYSTSVKYYLEAINLEEDNRVNAKDYLKIAQINQKHLNNLSQAKSYALKAASMQKKWGDPYIVLPSIYADAAGTCGSNAIEKNAVYWAAIDKLNYAKSIDPNVSSKVDKYIAAYKGSVPQKSTGFALGYKDGDRYSIGCWINETVVIKFY